VKVALESIGKGGGDKYSIGCGCIRGDLVQSKRRRTGLLGDFFVLFSPGELVRSMADNALFSMCVPESICISTTIYPAGEHAGCRPEDICRGPFPAWLNEKITAQIIEKVRFYVEVHPCLQS
jgi:hypothetical protein